MKRIKKEKETKVFSSDQLRKAKKMIDILEGNPPYSEPSNYCRGDGYYAGSIEEKFGASIEYLKEQIANPKISSSLLPDSDEEVEVKKDHRKETEQVAIKAKKETKKKEIKATEKDVEETITQDDTETEVKTLVSRAVFINKEISAVKKLLKPLEDELKPVKNGIMAFYERNLKESIDEVKAYTIPGLSEEVCTISEQKKVDPMMIFEAIDEDIELFLSMVSISQEAAKKVLPGNVVETCLVKDPEKTRMTFKG